MAVRKLAKSWQYDFKLSGFGRHRQGGYQTKAEALLAERTEREALLSGARQVLFSEAYAEYSAATSMKDRARDAYEHAWKRIKPELGHFYIEGVGTSALDSFKQTLPKHLGPKSINQHLILVRALLRFMWKRSKLKSVPYVPMESVPQKHVGWYTRQERDKLLEGIYRLEPQWYLFYYLTVRLGLRTGEVYGVAHSRILREGMQLVVDQVVQRGTKTRASRLSTRKTDEAYVLDITPDILAAVDWHISQGYGGGEFPSRTPAAFHVTSTATSGRSSWCRRSSGSVCSATTRWGGTRSRAKPSPAASRSRRCRPSSGIGPSRARTSTRTWAQGRRNGWSRP
ncbi:MAG: hypothetical protein WDO74_22350 [Pseudomonadota bacterium]